MIEDVIYNGTLAAVDVAVLVAVFETPGVVRRSFGVACVALGALVLAMMLGQMFLAMRLLAYGLFVHVPLVLLVLGWSFRDVLWMRMAYWVGAALLVGVAIDAFLIEPRWLEENTYVIESDKITRPLRLVLVADLQTDHVTGYERRAFQRVMDAKPDMILFAGDYLQVETHEEWERELPKLREIFSEVKLAAPRGIYAVAGNVDYPTWAEIFSGVDATVTPATRTFEDAGTAETRDAVRVTCLSLADSFDTQLELQAMSTADTDSVLVHDQKPESVSAFHIILGHGPDFALSDVKADLMLAGHVHGGQVRLPGIGPLVTLARVPRAWTSGVTSLANGRTLVVSRGIGMERAAAPRLRFFCRPQLIILDIVPSS